jgi:hypothetical protein
MRIVLRALRLLCASIAILVFKFFLAFFLCVLCAPPSPLRETAFA